MGLACFRAESQVEQNLVELAELIQKDAPVKEIAQYIKRNNLTRETFYKLYMLHSGSCIGTYDLRYPVDVAATSGRVDLFHLLLKYGYRTNETWLTQTLHKACSAGKLNVVRCLVEDFHEDVNEPDVNHPGNPPLILATRSGHLDVVKYLVSKGASVDVCNHKKETALHYSAKFQQDVVCAYLISQGADIQVSDNTGTTPLHNAAEYGSETIMNSLLDAGADIEARNDYDETPFYIAIKNKQESTAAALSRRGADPEAVAHRDKTPLDCCILEDMYTVARHLVLDLNVPLDAGHRGNKATPLAVAVMCGHSAFCNLFLLAGYTPVKDDDIYNESHKPAYRKRSGMLQDIRKMMSNPRSLQDLCVFKIRRGLSRTLPNRVDNLPLPLKLKNLVKLEHVRSMSYKSMSAYPEPCHTSPASNERTTTPEVELSLSDISIY